MALTDQEFKQSKIAMDALKEQGGNPGDFIWPFNGLMPDGRIFGMEVAEFVSWALALHPEYLDYDAGLPCILDFVFTQSDEEIMDIPGLAGTVMVTIRPDLDPLDLSYAEAAEKAAQRYPANPKARARFLALAEKFKEAHK